jgi:hypothetical protein
VGPERLAGPREPAAAEPFTPGRFIRPRVMLKPSSVGEWLRTWIRTACTNIQLTCLGSWPL